MSEVAFLGFPTKMNLIGSLERNEGFGQGDYFLVGKDVPSYIRPSNYHELIGSLEGNERFGQGDYFLMCQDFPSYIECQEQVDEAYKDRKRWTRMSILNTAGSYKFNSDKTIHEYAKDIWNIEPAGIHGSRDLPSQ